MSTRRRIGLVGCGPWGAILLRDLVSLGCAVSVVARSEESRRRAAEGGAGPIVPTMADLPAVDGLVVATATATHAGVVEEALDLDVPVFVEKPLTTDRESAHRLARRGSGRLFVMDKWRYHPGIEMLRDIAASGELGPVTGLRSIRDQWGSNHPDTDPVWVLAPHDLAIALEVLGEIPGPCAAVGERVNGVASGMFALTGALPWFAFEVSARYAGYRREIQLHCEDGIAILADSYADHVQVVRGSNPHDTTSPRIDARPISTELPTLRELRAFVEHLDGGPPPRSSAEEGAMMVDVLCRLREMAGLA